jgi:hypothetical protein
MRFPYRKALLFLSIGFALSNCGEKRNTQNSEALRQEMANREPKKVSDAEIIESAYTQGKIIADSSQKVIFNTLLVQLEEAGFTEALKFCNVHAYPITDSLSKRFGAIIKRVSDKPRNPLNSPDELETLLLDSYLYSVENNLPLEDNVQKIDENYLLYTKPIVINNGLCLQCHGKPEEEITEGSYAQIQSLYPEDKAIGYTHGDFRGIWSIKLSQKELVKAL